MRQKGESQQGKKMGPEIPEKKHNDEIKSQRKPGLPIETSKAG